MSYYSKPNPNPNSNNFDLPLPTDKRGNVNSKYIDVLQDDPECDKFALVSFILPEEILKKRENYIFEKFVKQWDLTTSMKKFEEFLHFISIKFNINQEKLFDSFKEFIEEEKGNFSSYEVSDDFHNFVDINETALTKEFNKINKFQTSVRGFKICDNGKTFDSVEEASSRARELIKQNDSFDIHAVPTGKFCPLDFNASKAKNVEYMIPELNQLTIEKIKNEAKAKEEFERRVRETKQNAIRENIEKAKQSGNVLTQTIDEDGNLTNIMQKINVDERSLADDEERERLFNESVANANSKKD